MGHEGNACQQQISFVQEDMFRTQRPVSHGGEPRASLAPCAGNVNGSAQPCLSLRRRLHAEYPVEGCGDALLFGVTHRPLPLAAPPLIFHGPSSVRPANALAANRSCSCFMSCAVGFGGRPGRRGVHLCAVLDGNTCVLYSVVTPVCCTRW